MLHRSPLLVLNTFPECVFHIGQLFGSILLLNLDVLHHVRHIVVAHSDAGRFLAHRHVLLHLADLGASFDVALIIARLLFWVILECRLRETDQELFEQVKNVMLGRLPVCYELFRGHNVGFRVDPWVLLDRGQKLDQRRRGWIVTGEGHADLVAVILVVIDSRWRLNFQEPNRTVLIHLTDLDAFYRILL